MKSSSSLYIEHNNSNKIYWDEYGKPINEVRVDAKVWNKGTL